MKRILLNTAALLFASAACEPAPDGLDAAPSAVPEVAESSRSLTGGL